MQPVQEKTLLKESKPRREGKVQEGNLGVAEGESREMEGDAEKGTGEVSG